MNIGCDDFEAKPIDFDQLLHKIARLLTGACEQREVAS